MSIPHLGGRVIAPAGPAGSRALERNAAALARRHHRECDADQPAEAVHGNLVIASGAVSL